MLVLGQCRSTGWGQGTVQDTAEGTVLGTVLGTAEGTASAEGTVEEAVGKLTVGGGRIAVLVLWMLACYQDCYQ